jgi:uncharacterized protein (DUF1778 family)
LYGIMPYIHRVKKIKGDAAMPPLDTHNASDRGASKTARLEARISPEQKALLERAAALSGRTLSEFVVSSAQETAARLVREQEVMNLGVRDRKAFVAALLKPSGPGSRLRRAARRYNKATGQ